MDIKAAVVYEARAPFQLEELTLDAPRADEILVAIAGTGVCHTDSVARDQILPTRLPAILGHEGAGVVIAIGSDVSRVAVGDHVVLSFQSCGHCGQCLDDHPAYCSLGPILNFRGLRADKTTGAKKGSQAIGNAFFGQSSFATHVLVTERNAVVIPKDVPLALMGPLGCGLQTGAGAVMRSLRCSEGSSILITGGGAVGLSAVMAAKIVGCSRIMLSDPVAARRELALELGATAVIDPTTRKLGEEIRKLVPTGCDYSLDTTGISEVMDTAIGALRPRGSFGLAAVPKNPAAPTPGSAVQMLTFGYRIVGIIEGDSEPHTFIPELIEHYRAGRFPIEKLIKTYAFEQINEAFDAQKRGLVVKPVLLMAH